MGASSGRAPDTAEVGPVEQHRKLRGVDLDGHRGRVHVRPLELAALEPPVGFSQARIFAGHTAATRR